MGKIAITTVHSDGRTSIPVEIRKKLGIKDDDRILWIESSGKYYIEKVD